MLNGYRGTAMYGYDKYITHPSSRNFSRLTSNGILFLLLITLDVMMAIAGIILWVNTIIWGIPLVAMAVSFAIAATVRVRNSYRITGSRYNSVLRPLEVKFNFLARRKKKRFAPLMEYAYQLCSSSGMSHDDLAEIKRISTLLDLHISIESNPNNNAKNFLREELETARLTKQALGELNDYLK